MTQTKYQTILHAKKPNEMEVQKSDGVVYHVPASSVATHACAIICLFSSGHRITDVTRVHDIFLSKSGNFCDIRQRNTAALGGLFLDSDLFIFIEFINLSCRQKSKISCECIHSVRVIALGIVNTGFCLKHYSSYPQKNKSFHKEV